MYNAEAYFAADPDQQCADDRQQLERSCTRAKKTILPSGCVLYQFPKSASNLDVIGISQNPKGSALARATRIPMSR